MRPLACLFLFLAASVCTQAQTIRLIDTEPPLATAFPLVTKGENVCVPFPVLVSTTTIIPPNAILRVIYVPPVLEDDRKRAIHTTNNSEAAWSRNNSLSEGARLSPSEEARLKISRETVWPSATNFQLALASLGADDIRIVYVTSNADATDFKFYDERIAFPEGLVLGETNNAVTVLAVEKKGVASQAGIKAGDIIVKTGDTPTNGSLATFLNGYHGTRHAAEVSLKTSFTLTIKSPGGTERAVSLRLPPTISGGFLDTPINSGTPSTNTKTNSCVNVPEFWEKKKSPQAPAPNP